jgi:hypothetical protein
MAAVTSPTLHMRRDEQLLTTTILPKIQAFMATRQHTDVVADRRIISAANKRAIEASGCRSTSTCASPQPFRGKGLARQVPR